LFATRPRRFRAHTLLALAASTIPLPALAQSWATGDGNWSDPANWSNSTVPGQDAIATIATGSSDTRARTILYDYTGPSIELHQIRIYNLGTGTNALAINANTLSVHQLYVGYMGTGVLNQAGGNVVSYDVSLGYFAGSSGVYNLSGGTLTTQFTGSPGIGMGYGTFNHSGGTHTVGSLGISGTPQNPSSYVMSGSAVLVASDVYVGAVGPGRFDQRGGTATLTGTLHVTGAGTNGAYLLSGGTLTAAATVNQGQFTQTGGTASLGAVSGTGTTMVSGTGSLTATAIHLSSLTLGTGATVSITAGGGTNGTSTLSQLSLAPDVRFDLADNALVLDYTGTSPIGSIRAAVAGGTLTSSLAGPKTALGYAEASSVLSPTGGAFAGQSADATAILVRLTCLGDANLDGTVNFDDLLRLAKNYNRSDADWQDGDFNRDGAVNFDDLLALAKNYGDSVPSAPLPDVSAAFTSDLAGAFATVPEPSLATLGLAAGGFALTARRRRPNPAAL